MVNYLRKILLLLTIILASELVSGQSHGWTVNSGDYENSGEVNAIVYLGPDLKTNGTLGAFFGGTCRGYADGVVFPPTGRTVFSVICYSNLESGETLTFKYFNPADNKTYDITESVAFTSDMIEGTAAVPLEFHAPLLKTLNLTGVLLEGLYNGSGLMREAWNDSGPQWGTGIADKITVELHSSAGYTTIIYTATNVNLNTNGTATVLIPLEYTGSYYITIKHRNSLETTTSAAVSFSGVIINQSFNSKSNAFGENMAISYDGRAMIFAGDVNQDGFIDTQDYVGVDNDSYNYMTGYLVSDVDGNGTVDTNDYIAIDNNNYNYVGTILPL